MAPQGPPSLKTVFEWLKNPYALTIATILCHILFAYDLARQDFPKLIALYTALFVFYVVLVKGKRGNFTFLLVSGILFRLVFLPVEPMLSQDFFRFIWDGQLSCNGINPYLYTPDELIKDHTLTLSNSAELHGGMGGLSAMHYSNYPPLNQLLFALAAFFGLGSITGSIIAMRLFIILADLGIVFFGQKLLRQLRLDPHLVFWYFLNPLVIIELTGNLHFEGVMLFLFCCAMHLIIQNKLVAAAPVFAASIMLKLVPLLLLPLLHPYLGWKKSIRFYMLVGSCCILFFLPFYHPQLISNYGRTLGLWFGNFEFNAGMYNLVKYIGTTLFDAKPWKLIKTYGSLIKILVMVLILALAFFKKQRRPAYVYMAMLWVLVGYYLLSATVHPWYLVFVLGISLFTQYRFMIIWTGSVMLSYYAYSQPDFKENLGLLAFEYLLVLGYLGYEIAKNHNISTVIRKKTP